MINQFRKSQAKIGSGQNGVAESIKGVTKRLVGVPITPFSQAPPENVSCPLHDATVKSALISPSHSSNAVVNSGICAHADPATVRVAVFCSQSHNHILQFLGIKANALDKLHALIGAVNSAGESVYRQRAEIEQEEAIERRMKDTAAQTLLPGEQSLIPQILRSRLFSHKKSGAVVVHELIYRKPCAFVCNLQSLDKSVDGVVALQIGRCTMKALNDFNKLNFVSGSKIQKLILFEALDAQEIEMQSHIVSGMKQMLHPSWSPLIEIQPEPLMGFGAWTCV